MNRTKYLIVMAAGSGSRMKSKTPKQFMDLGGKPILQRTLENFSNAIPDIKVITVLPHEYLITWKTICSNTGLIIPQHLVEGGITRFHSVRNALQHVPDGAIVAIQDGVRPLASPDFIQKLFRQAESHRALIPVLPCTDTLKSARLSETGEGIEPTGDPDPDRSLIWCAQTPQIFASEDIKAAYSQAFQTSFTDDASVAASYGIPISYALGERFNIKITTPEDMELARLLLGARI